MKNKVLLIVILITLLTSASCDSKNNALEEETNNVETPNLYEDIYEAESLNIMPFNERKFIYNNGLNIDYKQETINDNNINIEKYYPQIKGLINKKIEKNINDSIAASIDILINDINNTSSHNYSQINATIKSISANAHQVYSCNNVLFIRYFRYCTYNDGTKEINTNYMSADGFDLNTGNKLELKDLFKKGINYKKILNDYIYMEIIKSNYDDPDSMFMNKPFQGIQDKQSFAFNEDNLIIIMDEKNDEFNSFEYHVNIIIPLKEIGDNLAIFDRYFDEEINIFENNRIKKLMPNFIYFEKGNAILEREKHYNIQIIAGEFINLDNAETRNMLHSLIVHNMDIDGFKERAEAFKDSYPENYYGSLHHNADTLLQSGGYLSMVVYSTAEENGIYNNEQKYINFNFNNNQIMTLKDIFVDGFDYKTEILKILKENDNYKKLFNLPINEEAFLFSENKFKFSQDYVCINLYETGQETTDNFILIDYKDIGYENIAIFQ